MSKSIHRSPLKADVSLNGVKRGRQKKSEICKARERFDLGLEDGGSMCKEEHPKKLKHGSWLAAREETGTSVSQLRKLNSANIKNDLGSRFFPRDSR